MFEILTAGYKSRSADLTAPVLRTPTGVAPPANTYYVGSSPLLQDGKYAYVFSATSVYRLDLEAMVWQQINAAPGATMRSGTRFSKFINGAGHLIWGYDGSSMVKTAKAFNVSNYTFSPFTYPSTVALAIVGMTVLDDKIWMFGGSPSNSVNGLQNMAVFVFDPATGETTAHGTTNPTAPGLISGATVGNDGSGILVTGGNVKNGGSITSNKTVWRYDIATATWTQLAVPPYATSTGTSLPLINGKYWLIGDKSSSPSDTTNNLLYSIDPTTGVFTQEADYTSTFNTRRSGQLVDYNGRLFRFGGIEGITYDANVWELPPIK